ncbi:MAG: hypothetical protein KHX31_06365 [Akkermansia sp.]|uniref:hypothetical protein n=1 Tax=Akkermansia sp. TaxID=1872421 RepID=UPI0025C4DB7B|nr:hypothetical protein [Akkermansia sp.]MBS5508241.1 hypothetical protein [Akkermansia sp.]
MQQDTNNKTIVGTITIPPETFAAIRIGGGIPILANLVSAALSTWGAIGTTDPVELGDIHQALTEAADLLPQLQRDLVLLRDAMLARDTH